MASKLYNEDEVIEKESKLIIRVLNIEAYGKDIIIEGVRSDGLYGHWGHKQVA
jgi:hypothetical protein